MSLEGSGSSDFEKRSLNKIIALCHSWGWDGVENSKILEVFLEEYVQGLQDRLEVTTAQGQELFKLRRLNGQLMQENHRLRRSVPDQCGDSTPTTGQMTIAQLEARIAELEKALVQYQNLKPLRFPWW